MKAILAILCLYAVFRSTETAAGGMMCVYKGLQLSLDDAIHVSDVVFTGRILAMREGSGGTLTATVSYYFAYKRDQYLRKPGFGLTDVENFAISHAHMSGESGLFFLVREPNRKLALQCIAPLRSPQVMGPFENILEALDHVNKVGKEDNERNEIFVPPDPNPCDSILTNHCSREGSQCSVMNTLPGEEYRCTCLTGYVGNGVNCTRVEALPTATPTTPPNYECPQCSYGGLCQNPTQLTSLPSCDCSHIECTDDRSTQRVCGTDGVTYRSLCKLQLEACLIQQPVFPLHEGDCDLQNVRPCGGMSAPLTNQTAVVRCGDCPPMYFCHTTELYSVCCLLEVMPPPSHIATIVTTPSTTPTSHIATIVTTPSTRPTSHVATIVTTPTTRPTSHIATIVTTPSTRSTSHVATIVTTPTTRPTSHIATIVTTASTRPTSHIATIVTTASTRPTTSSSSFVPTMVTMTLLPTTSPMLPFLSTNLAPSSTTLTSLSTVATTSSPSLLTSPTLAASHSPSLQSSPASHSPSLQPLPASHSPSLQPSSASPTPSPLQPSSASPIPSPLQPSPASPTPSPLQPSPASSSSSLQPSSASPTPSPLQLSPASPTPSLQPSPASSSSSLQPSPASHSPSLQPSPTETIDMSGSGDDVMMSGDFSGGSGFIASGDVGSGSGDAGSGSKVVGSGSEVAGPGSEVGSEVIGFEDTLVDDEDWFAQRKRRRRGLRHHFR